MSFDIFQENILDHYRNPRNYGKIDSPDISSRDANPLCGDEIEIQIRIENDRRIKDIKFQGHGCAISQASADILADFLSGKNIEKIKSIKKKDVLDLLGIELGPIRLKCALLPLKVLKVGIYKYLGRNNYSEKSLEE